MDIINKFNRIYSKLEDDISKEIYNAKIESILYKDNYRLLNKVIESGIVFQSKEWEEFIADFDKDVPIAIFGSGPNGRYALSLLRRYYPKSNVIAFVDNDKTVIGNIIQDIPICSLDDICREYDHSIFLIASVGGVSEIYEQLLKFDIARRYIFYPRYKKLFGKFGNQYFDLPALKHAEHEVFIDAGCYDGTTSLEFAKWCGFQYEKIYAFEPDPLCKARCIENAKKWGIKNFNFINKGTYCKEETLSFSANGMAGGRIEQKGQNYIDVTSIDKIVSKEGQKVTFIKMDVEGSELASLRGARDTILKYRPKLAICIYHKDEDLIEIPNYILELIPDYKLYIRHYSNFIWETVLYAV